MGTVFLRLKSQAREAAIDVQRPATRNGEGAKKQSMKWLSRFIVFAVASSGPGVAAQDVPSQARADLAPTGKLRVALLPLPHIAVRDKDTGDFKGVVVDLRIGETTQCTGGVCDGCSRGETQPNTQKCKTHWSTNRDRFCEPRCRNAQER